MAAGYIIGDQCLDVATAGHVFSLGVPRSLTFDGTSTHLHQTVYDQNDNEFAIRHFVDGAFVDSVVFVPSFQPCDTTDIPYQNFADGAMLGWGVAAAMVAAWAIHTLRRGL